MCEIITLAHINVKKYAYTFEHVSGNIYKKQVNKVVASVIKDNVSMSESTDKLTLTNNQFFFDDTTFTLYVYDASIDDSEYLITYKLLFSTAPIELTHDLSEDGTICEYLTRLTVTSAFNIKIDASAVGTAIIGAGTIKLQNVDGYFNDWTGYIWERQQVKLYSIERGQAEDNAVLIYDGVITSKDVDRSSVNIKISNELNIVNKSVESSTISYGMPQIISLNDDIQGIYRNRIWGKVDGVKCQPLDVNPETFTLSGSVVLSSSSNTVNGTGTLFLTQISSGDNLLTSSGEHEVIDVVSNTSLILSEIPTSNYSGAAQVVYNVVNPSFNRVWDISSRPLRETVVNILYQPASTIYEVDNISDLEIGDNILVHTNSQEYLRQIESIFAKNIVINQAIPTSLSGTSYITRKPIQRCYYNKKEISVIPEAISITNSNDCYITLSREFESYAGKVSYIDASGSWIGSSGTNYISRSVISEEITDLLLPRNYFLYNGTLYEIASVTTTDTYTRIRFTTNLASSVSSQGLFVNFVNTLSYDSDLVVDVIGETQNGTSSGAWIKNGIQFLRQQLTEAGLGDKITDSFDMIGGKSDHVISLIAPISPGQKTMPKLKTLVDQLNGSIGGALFVNKDFKFDYKIIDFSFDYSKDPIFIEEYDLISWSKKEERNDLNKDINFSYRSRQINYSTLKEDSSFYQSTNQLAAMIGNITTLNFESCLYNEIDARSMANRMLFLTTLLNTTLQIKTDLRFYNLNILDIVEIKLNNFTSIIPGYPNRYMLVLEIKKDSDSMEIVLGDLGSSISRRGIIVPNTFVNYSGAANNEVLKSSYITDNRGLENNEEDTKGFNLII